MDDCLKCQTSTAAPAEPGGLPLTLQHVPTGVNWDSQDAMEERV